MAAGEFRVVDAELAAIRFVCAGIRSRDPRLMVECAPTTDQLSISALKALFGRKDFQLLADDGRLFHLRFSDTEHVTGELPTTPRNWRN
jgi:hypothetical protein